MPFLTSAPVADWLQLWRLTYQSSRHVALLIKIFSTPRQALQASVHEWQQCGVAPALVARLQAWQSGDDPDVERDMQEGVAADLHWCEQNGQGVLACDHDAYPLTLREMADPPPLIFWRGDTALLTLPQVAIVGTRHPTLTGARDAALFAADMARAGLVVTSGLARGVDAAAHEGALSVQGKTIAVLGTGPDRFYPKENRALQERIVAEGGLLISEYRPGTLPQPQFFPQRNRIISGLSLGVLVVEAAPDSGSLITAKQAAEQGRLVWALPGSRHQPQSRGCLQLIREGATLVTQPQELLADLPPMMEWVQPQDKRAETIVPVPTLPLGLSSSARQLLEALGSECRHADWLIEVTGQNPANALRELMMLEMAGVVASVPGGYERVF